MYFKICEALKKSANKSVFLFLVDDNVVSDIRSEKTTLAEYPYNQSKFKAETYFSKMVAEL